jgi:hypothetical protein
VQHCFGKLTLSRSGRRRDVASSCTAVEVYRDSNRRRRARGPRHALCWCLQRHTGGAPDAPASRRRRADAAKTTPRQRQLPLERPWCCLRLLLLSEASCGAQRLALTGAVCNAGCFQGFRRGTSGGVLLRLLVQGEARATAWCDSEARRGWSCGWSSRWGVVKGDAERAAAPAHAMCVSIGRPETRARRHTRGAGAAPAPHQPQQRPRRAAPCFRAPTRRGDSGRAAKDAPSASERCHATRAARTQQPGCTPDADAAPSRSLLSFIITMRAVAASEPQTTCGLLCTRERTPWRRWESPHQHREALQTR